MQKSIEKGTNKVDVSWIPEKFAQVGNIIKVKTDEGWEITKVFSKKEKKYIENKERDYLKQRKVSDM